MPLTAAQSRSLGEVLEVAGQDHPWPDDIASTRFGGSRDGVRLTKVQPNVVVEVSADTARQGGGWRHGLRLVRYRPDLDAADVPQLPPTTA